MAAFRGCTPSRAVQVRQGLQASQAPTACGSFCHHPGTEHRREHLGFHTASSTSIFAESEPPECDVLPCLCSHLPRYQPPVRSGQPLGTPRYSSVAAAAEAGVAGRSFCRTVDTRGSPKRAFSSCSQGCWGLAGEGYGSRWQEPFRDVPCRKEIKFLR